MPDCRPEQPRNLDAQGLQSSHFEENKSDFSSDISDLEFVTEEQVLLDNARDDDEIRSLYRRLVAEGKAKAIRLQASTLKVVPEKKRNGRSVTSIEKAELSLLNKRIASKAKRGLDRLAFDQNNQWLTSLEHLEFKMFKLTQ